MNYLFLKIKHEIMGKSSNIGGPLTSVRDCLNSRYLLHEKSTISRIDTEHVAIYMYSLARVEIM